MAHLGEVYRVCQMTPYIYPEHARFERIRTLSSSPVLGTRTLSILTEHVIDPVGQVLAIVNISNHQPWYRRRFVHTPVP